MFEVCAEPEGRTYLGSLRTLHRRQGRDPMLLHCYTSRGNEQRDGRYKKRAREKRVYWGLLDQ